MMKKFLSVLAVVLLATMLTVFAFAADGGYSSLVLKQDSTVDYTALEEGDEITVYIVVSPTLRPSGAQYTVYRPFGTGKADKNVTLASNADIYSQKYTVSWDSSLLELKAAPVTLVGISNADADATANDGTSLYYVAMADKGVNRANVIAPSVSSTWTNSVDISYSNGGDKFAGFIINGNTTAGSSGLVAALTFKVKNAGADTTTAINLTDKYVVKTANAAETVYNATNDTARKSLSVTVKAGCLHANKSNEATEPSTCYKQGTYTYHCDDCGTDVEEKLPFEPHNYKNAQGEDNRLYYKAPTCIREGESYLYCSNEGCTHYDESSYVLEAPAGHTWVKVVASELTCVTDGDIFYYCSVCYRMASDATSEPAKDAAYNNTCYYNPEDGLCYTNHTSAEGFTLPTSTPMSCHFITEAQGHDLDVDADGNYYCKNEGLCDITGDFTVRYVGNSVNGDGSSPENFTSLERAMYHFSTCGLEDVECYVYLVEDITLTPSVYDSEYNKNADSFEEYPHDVHVTITSADVNDKAVITMPKTCTRYYLYGPTTFEYVKFASDEKNTIASLATDGTPQGTTNYNRYIAARGFKLVLGEGLEMLNKGSGLETAKTNSGVAGLKAESVITSDMKLYAIAGVEGSTDVVGGREGFNPTNFTTEMEVLSGSYWSVYAFNRNGAASYDDCVAKITLGNIAVDTITTNTEGVPMNNCHVYYMYTGKVTTRWDLRFAYSSATTGSGNVINRFFFPGFTGSIIGDSMLNSTKKVGFTLNLYYYDNGTVSLENDSVVNGLVVKQSKLGEYPLAILGDVKSITEWCVNKGADLFGENGHFIGDDGRCEFCGIKVCKEGYHRGVEWVVDSESNCMTDGEKHSFCTYCFETLETVSIPKDEKAHSLVWMFNGDVPTQTCSICGTTVADASGKDFSNIYVSVNGAAAGGFAPGTPVNNFEAALKLAALADGPATIHILDKAVIVSNTASTKGYYAFLEPTHSNEITITGYNGNVGVLEVGGGTGTTARITYNLSGATKFENIEFYAGASTGNIYVCGRHNHLTFGENVSTDVNRAGDNTVARMVVTGGCYDETFGCSQGDNHLTLYSGNFFQAIGADIRTDCPSANTLVEVFGNIITSEQFIFGGYQKVVGDVVGVIDGVITSNGDITFAGDNAGATAENVTIILRSGTMVSEVFSSVVNRPLGAAEKGETPATRINGKLHIYYDPSVSTTQMLYNRILPTLGADRAKFEGHIITADNYCTVTNSAHTPAGEALDSLAATCLGEGYNVYECGECGEEYTEVVAILPHNLVDAGDVAANCANPARHKQVCSNDGCGAVVFTVTGSSVDASAHNVVDGICEYCGRTNVQICEADNGHEFGPEIAVDGSCGSGTKRVCDTCGFVEVNIESSLHNYGAFTVTVEPTETTPGVKSRTCKSCGKVDTDILYVSDSVYTDPFATDAEGNAAALDIALSKLSKYERAAINSLLQETAYGSEVKVSYSVDANGAANITYSIPVPAEYNDMTNVKVVVKDDSGKFHVVDFKLDGGYIVFTF